MSEEIHLTIRQAVPNDANALLNFVNKTVKQTDYLLDHEESQKDVEEQEESLKNIYESKNNVLIVALDEDTIIGTFSVHGSQKVRIEHIGEIGLVVEKDYWGLGLGTILMEEGLAWAEENTVLKRLELHVQKRNERAIYLYEKFGFEKEAEMAYGIKIDEEFHTVLLMSKLLNKK